MSTVASHKRKSKPKAETVKKETAKAKHAKTPVTEEEAKVMYDLWLRNIPFTEIEEQSETLFGRRIARSTISKRINILKKALISEVADREGIAADILFRNLTLAQEEYFIIRQEQAKDNPDIKRKQTAVDNLIRLQDQLMKLTGLKADFVIDQRITITAARAEEYKRRISNPRIIEVDAIEA